MSNIPVADAHCDFLYYMTQDGWDINRPTRNQAVALPYIKQGGGKLPVLCRWGGYGYAARIACSRRWICSIHILR